MQQIWDHIYILLQIFLCHYFNEENFWNNIKLGTLVTHEYQPPPLEVYTKFSLQTYFFVFWGILSLQSLTIFVIDKIWVRNVPNSAKCWNRILHAVQKCSFPFPYTNWHQENGSCDEHHKRKQAVQHEVLAAILINLLFYMILLVPLPIFCKIWISVQVMQCKSKMCFLFLQQIMVC